MNAFPKKYLLEGSKTSRLLCDYLKILVLPSHDPSETEKNRPVLVGFNSELFNN